MSGMPLETCWAFNKFWNKKFYYKVASCWLFLLIHTMIDGSMNIKIIFNEVNKNKKYYFISFYSTAFYCGSLVLHSPTPEFRSTPFEKHGLRVRPHYANEPCRLKSSPTCSRTGTALNVSRLESGSVTSACRNSIQKNCIYLGSVYVSHWLNSTGLD